MDHFNKKTFETSRGYTYAYYTYTPEPPTSKPALLFCHGWPDDSSLWQDIVPALLDLGHRLVIPDLLGYGGTSKPTDYKEYSMKAMSNDLYELLDSESIDSVVPVGHDWGSGLAQRVYLYRPERCKALVTLNVAYMAPSPAPFDLAAINSTTEKHFGYPMYAYWDLFAADDGPEILLRHVETLFHLLHWDHPDGMKTVFCTYGNTRRLLTTTSPSDYPLKPHAQKAGFKEAFLERMQRDTFEAPQCWYKAFARNVQLDDAKVLAEGDLTIRVPCLYIAATEDAVCRTDMIEPVKHLIPDLTIKPVVAGHWDTYEKPEEVREILRQWLKEKFGG